MAKRKVLTIVGARPQFVKAAPLVSAFRKRFAHTLLHTGQHHDEAMSAAFFRELGIPEPDIQLGIRGGTHGEMTGAMLGAIEQSLVATKPDIVVVLGDTNSTLAGSLAAVKLHIPVAHVEAGLRSFDDTMPEEVNRKVTDHVASLLFCPTKHAATLLKKEGITRGVIVSGDVMVDVMRSMQKQARTSLRALDLPKDFYFATVHRQENTDNEARLSSIVSALGSLPCDVLLPLHPRTKKQLEAFKIPLPGRVRVLGPLPYTQSLGLIQASRAVLTDSGGLQKEAFLLGRACVTMRDNTEWTETLAGGANRLVGANTATIIRAIRAIERTPPKVRPGKTYGNGHASERIATAIERFLRG